MCCRLMMYVIAILLASISFVTVVWGDCDQSCNPPSANHSSSNSQSFEFALSIAYCYANCTSAEV